MMGALSTSDNLFLRFLVVIFLPLSFFPVKGYCTMWIGHDHFVSAIRMDFFPQLTDDQALVASTFDKM